MTIGQAQAASITTTFGSNNGFAGNMFDITTFGNALTVNSLAVNLDSGTTSTISVFTKSGSYVGFTNNAAPWTLVSQISGITSAGINTPTLVDIADFNLLANSVTGIYVTSDMANIRYTNGANIFANTDLRLDLGVGKGLPLFTGSTFSPRTWNGTINYTVQNGSGTPGAVPEPGTVVLMGTGLTGLVAWRMRKGKAKQV